MKTNIAIKEKRYEIVLIPESEFDRKVLEMIAEKDSATISSTREEPQYGYVAPSKRNIASVTLSLEDPKPSPPVTPES